MNQQIKPNFKDQACLFGGDIFTDLVDKASDVFDTLEPPLPSLLAQQQAAAASYSSVSYRNLSATPTPTPTRTATLAAYNNSSNPCFIGDCNITMVDGSFKMVKDLVKGDFVKSLLNPYDSNSNIVGARVICVLQTNIIDGETDIVSFPNGKGPKGITPWHPMVVEDNWMFPCNLVTSMKVPCTAVYSIVFDDFHTCMIDDTWCIALGHGYMMGILDHSYFGTQAVISDLMKLPGWNDGHIVIDNNCIVRDCITGMVSSINAMNNVTNHSDKMTELGGNTGFNLYG